MEALSQFFLRELEIGWTNPSNVVVSVFRILVHYCALFMHCSWRFRFPEKILWRWNVVITARASQTFAMCNTRLLCKRLCYPLCHAKQNNRITSEHAGSLVFCVVALSSCVYICCTIISYIIFASFRHLCFAIINQSSARHVFVV